MKWLEHLIDSFVECLAGPMRARDNRVAIAAFEAEKDRFKRENPREWEFLYGDRKEDDICYW